MNQNQPILVLLCYARSGGTVFSRVLSSLPNVLLVSEVSPVLNAKGSMAQQVEKWYGLHVPDVSFAENAKAIYAHSNKADLRFVLRDFSFIDFTPHVLNRNSPAKDFLTLKKLGKELPIFPFAFVRDAFDVWISRNCPPNFSEHYLSFVQQLLAEKIPIFKYEDFTLTPKKVLAEVCELTGLTYAEEAITNGLSSTKITGDTDLTNPSRGNLLQKIAPLKRKQLPQFLVKRALADENMKEANRLLGYAENFLDAQFEEPDSKLKLEVRWLLKRAFKKYPTDLC